MKRPQQSALSDESGKFCPDQRLHVLHKISTILLRRSRVGEMISQVLDVLGSELNLIHAALTLCRGNDLSTETTYGFSQEEKNRAQYRLGEGITGKVALSGEPMIVPDTTADSRFLNRTQGGALAQRSHLSFICVPVKQAREVIGTLSIHLPAVDGPTLDALCELLCIVSNIISDASVSLRAEVEEREMLRAENERLRQQLGENFRSSRLVGNCAAMRKVYADISLYGPMSAPILVRGGYGTGKVLVARALHDASERRNGPFVTVNCAGLGEALIEGEIFGREKVAKNGRVDIRKGAVEKAAGGTLYLSEIGELPEAVQVKLLRLIKHHLFERVGAFQSYRSQFRLICASSKNLEAALKKGTLREDLFYEINVFCIHIPDLNERKSDIVLLADYFLERYNKVYDKNVCRISTPAINMMMAYHWPGNVRELENAIERAIMVSGNNVINAYDLPPSLQTPDTTGTSVVPMVRSDANLETLVNSFERELIVDALKNCRGNVAKAAQKLGSTERIVHYKIMKLGIKIKMFK